MVNETSILLLKETSGKLEVSNIPLEDNKYILTKIDDAVENPNKTLMDVQSLFFNEVQPIRDYYPYTYPYAYTSSYLEGVSTPKKYTYEEYTEALNDEQKRLKEERIDYAIGIKQKAINKLRENYAKQCKRYIHQQTMYKAFQEAEKDPSVKMYSRETIGWNNFVYMITKDVKACVSTNFGYGFASYFLLTISYKGIVIAPYTHIVRYYKANMIDIIKNTRDYCVDRDNWNAAINFVKDFAEQSLANPASFVENYMMNEINEMMRGLSQIMDDSCSVLTKFKNEDDGKESAYYRLRFISSMSKYEKEYFEVFPHEMSLIFKAEKLSQAVDLLENLKKLGEVYQKINDCIAEIYHMVEQLTSDIQKELNGIEGSITERSMQKESLEKEKEQLNEKIKVFEDELDDILGKLPEGSMWQDRQKESDSYAKEHIEYVALKEMRKIVEDNIARLDKDISSLKVFVYRLSKCTNNYSVRISHENIA